MKAPRLIARSICRPRQVGGAREIRKDHSGQAKCDLANTETHSNIPNGRSCHSSRVKGAAAGGDRLSTASVGTAPAGV